MFRRVKSSSSRVLHASSIAKIWPRLNRKHIYHDHRNKQLNCLSLFSSIQTANIILQHVRKGVSSTFAIERFAYSIARAPKMSVSFSHLLLKSYSTKNTNGDTHTVSMATSTTKYFNTRSSHQALQRIPLLHALRLHPVLPPSSTHSPTSP